MAARARLAGLALAVALAGAGACGPSLTNRLNPFAPPTGSDLEERERELGASFDRELRRQLRVLQDPIVTGFLSDLGQSIVREIEPQPFVYHFRVVRDPRENAFAVPGGYIYFHSGTLLAAQSVSELAGVMAHEIAHVRHHHSARMQQQSQLPDLLTGLVGIGVSIAVEDSSPAVAALAVNQAIQLRFSRELESEADRVGAILVARAGHSPASILPFFERILAERGRDPERQELPPYLYTHPDVEARMAAIRVSADALVPQRSPDPALAADLPAVQQRLRQLLSLRRDPLPPPVAAQRAPEVDATLERARELRDEKSYDEALLLLARAESQAPLDPRVPFAIGSLLLAAGRPEQAVPALRRAARLDFSTARIYLQLGLAYRDTGQRHQAGFAFEQALARAGDRGALRFRLERELEKLSFPLVLATGFGEPLDDAGDADAPAPLERVARDAPRVVFWLRLGPHFEARAPEVSMRWIAPGGALVQEGAARVRARAVVASELGRDTGSLAGGIWRVEGWLDGARFVEREFEVR